jgi:hypothetical protein
MDTELMTLSAIKQDSWIAVIMPLPQAADLGSSQNLFQIVR